jgi:ABC-type nickel/cobalt efflux system permease component RcnA
MAFALIQWGILGITATSFFISAYTRGSKDYVFIGLGVLITYLGRNIFLNSDTWISPAPGLIILSLGTWFICTKLHKIYLWF